MPAAGIFIDAVNTVKESLQDLNLLPVTDPRNARPGTVMIELPTFDAFTFNVADVRLTIRVLAPAPGNQDSGDYLMKTVDTIMNSEIAVIDGRPGFATYGNQDLPTYDLTIGVAMRRN